MFAIFPELLQASQRSDIETLAVLVRRYFGDRQIYAPNLKLTELGQSLGMEILNEGRHGLARLEVWDASGQYRLRLELSPELRAPADLNFLMAELLGHVFLELLPQMASGDLRRTVYERKQNPLHRILSAPDQRSPADDFALALLLPLGMVKKAMGSLSSTRDVAALFQVDPRLLALRLELIGYRPAPAQAAADPRSPSQSPTPKSKRAPAPEAPASSSSSTRAAAHSKADAIPPRPRTPSRAASRAADTEATKEATPESGSRAAGRPIAKPGFPTAAVSQKTASAPLAKPSGLAAALTNTARPASPLSSSSAAADVLQALAGQKPASPGAPVPQMPSPPERSGTPSLHGRPVSPPPPNPTVREKAAPSPAPASRAAAPAGEPRKASAQPEDEGSMNRIKRSVAAMSYRKEDTREEATGGPTEEKTAKKENAEGKPGLERLRSIARKIDRTVD